MAHALEMRGSTREIREQSSSSISCVSAAAISPQGFFLARPLSGQAVTELLQARTIERESGDERHPRRWLSFRLQIQAQAARGPCEVRRLRYTAAIVLTLLLVACSSVPRESEPSGDAGIPIARSAALLIGAPYHFGGADLQGFDCSGLAVYVYEARVWRSRTARNSSARRVLLRSIHSRPAISFFPYPQSPRQSRKGSTSRRPLYHAPRSGQRFPTGTSARVITISTSWRGSLLEQRSSITSVPSPH